jgi:hypothetical protein
VNFFFMIARVDENANAIVVKRRVVPEVLARPEYEAVFVWHRDG